MERAEERYRKGAVEGTQRPTAFTEGHRTHKRQTATILQPDLRLSREAVHGKDYLKGDPAPMQFTFRWHVPLPVECSQLGGSQYQASEACPTETCKRSIFPLYASCFCTSGDGFPSQTKKRAMLHLDVCSESQGIRRATLSGKH